MAVQHAGTRGIMGLTNSFVCKIVLWVFIGGLSHLTCTISVSGVKFVKRLGLH